jgi:hypothetical protein
MQAIPCSGFLVFDIEQPGAESEQTNDHHRAAGATALRSRFSTLMEQLARSQRFTLGVKRPRARVYIMAATS